MSASTDPREAWRDRECERIMKMSVEEMAEEEGITVEELLEQGRQMKERMLKRLARRFPAFAKKNRS